MIFFKKHFFLFSILLIINLIISLSLYFIFENYSYDGPKRVFKNFYTIDAERNFEFADLDILTSEACFSNCKFFEKNIENKYLNILKKEALKANKFEYIINKDDDIQNIFFNRTLIEQRICIDYQECLIEIETIFKNSIVSFNKYLNTHIDELISLTEYNQNNKIYALVENETNQEIQNYEDRVEDVATKLLLESGDNLAIEEAVKKAKNIVLTIMNDVEKPEINLSYSNQVLSKLLMELKNFKSNRLSKIPKYYQLKFVQSKDWELGLKESQYRYIFYNIPNIIKSLLFFTIILIFSLIIIRIINRLRLN
tara:strand:+ start:10452 stop:11384 length:933 start_codon:yes stop_codon:yes gene_type:complete